MSNNIENLFTQYYQILRAYALRYVQNQDAAEDIVQDVFFELWLRRNEIDFDLPMKAYLFKSVLNKSRNYIYDKRVKDKISFDSDNDIQFIDDYLQSFVVYQEDSLLLKDLDREIKTYVESLPEQCHRIFIMSRSLNLKNKDIALRLGISIKTVEKLRMDGQNEIKEIDRLILKYLEGEASKDEKIALYRWIELSEENKTHFKEAQELWLSTQAILAPKEDTEKALQRFRSKIKNYNRRGKTFRKPLYYITQCAAIIVILLGLYYFFTRESNPEQYACVEMAIGNKGCITLPDSTVVWLNSGSKLTYPSRFSDKKRKVRLNGQAYFKVFHKEDQPFVVETNDMDIKVLGTSFVVKNYIRDEIIETALVDGHVEVYFPNSSVPPITLQPAEQVTYSRKTKETKIYTRKDSSLYHIWAQEKLLLSNCELTEVIEKLGAWYNVTMTCTNTSPTPVYMTLTVRTEPLKEILQTLKSIAPIDYRFNNDTVYIEHKPNS